MTEQSAAVMGREQVLIVGASFAGLATAYWMKRLGYGVTVVEMAKSLKKGGTPVDIREGVVEVMARMGLLERIKMHSLKDRPLQFLNGEGAPIGLMPDDGDGSRVGYEIERDDLLDLLFHEVEEDVEFIFDDSLSTLEERAGAVDVTLKSGGQRTFSLVIGCDGTHSAVRRMCFGEEAEFLLFMQNYFSLTIVDKLLLEENHSQMFNVPGLTVMLNAYNNKTDIAFCFFAEKQIAYDRRDPEEQREMVRRHFAGQGWRIPELLEEMNACDNFYFDQLCQIRMKAWSRGRVTLVGDAAYCPSPAAGMGGSMAILGAAALGEAMAKYPGDFATAFEEYDRSFRPVAESIQENAIEFGMKFVMPRSKEELAQRNLQLGGG